jgi:hypothetical protein
MKRDLYNKYPGVGYYIFYDFNKKFIKETSDERR